MALGVSTARLAGGVTLSYAEQGRGPALVLLPGPTDSWRSYEPLLARLPESVRAFAVSQRGHGDSDKPPSGYRVEDMAGDIGLFLDAVGIERAVVAGHSGAGLVARRLALDAPGRVAGLVLLAAPTTLRGDPGLEGFVSSVVAGLTDPLDPAMVRSWVGDTAGPDLPPSFVDDMVEEVLKVPARVWQQTFGALLQYDDTDQLGRIAAPALLVWGTDDDLVDRGMQEFIASRIPDAELVAIPDIGHAPHCEDPARVAAEVAAFVERLGRTAVHQDPTRR
jgi:pimeloyl-ACP methyl ester carboxylesterase